AHAAALDGRLLVGRRQHRRDTASRPERADVVRRAVAVRAVDAVAGDRAVDQPRIRFRQRRVVEPQPRQGPGSEVRDEDVGAGDELACDRMAFVRLEAQHDRALAAVVELEGGMEGNLDSYRRGEDATKRVAVLWPDLADT